MKKWIKIALPGIVYLIGMSVFFSLLFRDEIDIKDTTELTIKVEDAYLHFDQQTIIVKSSDESYFYFSYRRRGDIAEVSKYEYYDFCKVLKNEGIVTIRYKVSYTIFPQYWRIIVDLRTDDTVYFSIDDVNEMNRVSAFEIVLFVILFLLCSLPFLLLYIGYIVLFEVPDAKDERDRKKRNQQKMLKKKSGKHLPGKNEKTKK